ncbi:hypothetical protein SLEP1_g45538 [Rubroshorea leprosula]|uniref:Uncharacterized protein n=1 Tax=Rubroshorea leprosula TaxID=152421 RepID=A0AAV5LLX8_9ROSI|nr:hypothetical protein SLEP1_g45538 [Rubroshorea leprosula]
MGNGGSTGNTDRGGFTNDEVGRCFLTDKKVPRCGLVMGKEIPSPPWRCGLIMGNEIPSPPWRCVSGLIIDNEIAPPPPLPTRREF